MKGFSYSRRYGGEIEAKRKAGVDNPEQEYADYRHIKIKFRNGRSSYVAASAGGCGPP